MQDLDGISPWIISIQILIMHTINSSELSDVLSRESNGSLKRQALPVIRFYPPSPNSDASNR